MAAILRWTLWGTYSAPRDFLTGFKGERKTELWRRIDETGEPVFIPGIFLGRVSPRKLAVTIFPGPAGGVYTP